MAPRDPTVDDRGTPAGSAPLPSSSGRDRFAPSPANGGPRQSLEDIPPTIPVQSPRLWRRLFAFAGPAYLVSVGYMDPGNWGADIEGGSRFGYELLWVLLLSNGMAL